MRATPSSLDGDRALDAATIRILVGCLSSARAVVSGECADMCDSLPRRGPSSMRFEEGSGTERNQDWGLGANRQSPYRQSSRGGQVPETVTLPDRVRVAKGPTRLGERADEATQCQE